MKPNPLPVGYPSMKFDRNRLSVKPVPSAVCRREADQGMERGERWLFGLLFAAVLFALGQQLTDTSHFVRQLPQFTDTVRVWLSKLS